MGNNTFLEKTDHIKKQFLCNVPLKNFEWNNVIQDLTYDNQEILLSKTVNSELVLKYQIQTSYQRAFLKYLIESLEKQESEICDELYSAYGRLVALPTSIECFKHYFIGRSGNILSLKENVNLISDGTTGLRTWQASLALSEWTLQNDEAFSNKAILELGSGIGLTGLVLVKECSPSCVYFTDCHSSVLKSLCDNVKLNIEENDSKHTDSNIILDASYTLERLKERCMYSNLGNSNIFILNLPWEDINEEECLKLGTINKVIAADVVYDCELFEPLIKALTCLSRFCAVEEFIFSCTERNPQTLKIFLKQISDASFNIEELQVPTQENFIWPTDTSIRILRFTSVEILN